MSFHQGGTNPKRNFEGYKADLCYSNVRSEREEETAVTRERKKKARTGGVVGGEGSGAKTSDRKTSPSSNLSSRPDRHHPIIPPLDINATTKAENMNEKGKVGKGKANP